MYLDSIHIRVNVNKHKFTREMIHDEAKTYQDKLGGKISRQRIKVGEHPFILGLGKEVKLREGKINKTGPESGYHVKGERGKQFAYSAYTSCGDNGFILSTVITPGNIYDSQVAFQLAKQSKRLFSEINCVVTGVGYKTSKFAHFLTHLDLRPCSPYSRPRGKKGLPSKNKLLYDGYFDCYICPQDQVLAFSTVTREGCQEYKSNPEECVNCPLLNQYTKSKSHQRVITRHAWGGLMDEVKHPRLADLNKSVYEKRKQTIERIFVDVKEKYGMHWTKYRGLERVTARTTLVFATMNLKKSITWLWKDKGPLFFCPKIRNEVGKKLFQARVTSSEQLLLTV